MRALAWRSRSGWSPREGAEMEDPQPWPPHLVSHSGEVLQSEHPKAIGVSRKKIPSGSRSSPICCTLFQEGLPDQCSGADIFISQAEAAEDFPHYPALDPPGWLLSPDPSSMGQSLRVMEWAGDTYLFPLLLQRVYSLCKYQGRSHLSMPSGNTSAIPHVKISLSL